MSKLYTEEQVKQMIDDAHNGIDGYYDIFKKHIPIQLPTDEEIYQEAKSKGGLFVNWNMYETSAFVMGAQWMRDKIKGGQE